MPYQVVTLGQFTTQVGEVMDDSNHTYWTVPEIQSTIYEFLRVWGAYTNYWKIRGTFDVNPGSILPFYDLAAVLPAYRTRTWTLNQMVMDIQAMLLENDSGVAGTGMSGQITVTTILSAIRVARNKFVLDVRFPLTVKSGAASPPPTQGIVSFNQESVFVHRVGWKDTTSGVWSNVWRQDEWIADKGSLLWPIEPGIPQEYSEASMSPLQIQLIPPPANTGEMETLSVDSYQMDLTNPDTTFRVPDEWVHAIKYGALSYILNGEGQIKDVLRGAYAESRYQQAVQLAKDARSVIRLMSNGIPLAIDTLYNVDAGLPYWRNQTGPPQMAGVFYDFIAIVPGVPNAIYSIAADVVRSAPLPANDSDFIQIGSEDLDNMMDYVTHVLTFKCGGNDFKSTMPAYDSFMTAVGYRNKISAAKIQYLTPLFGQTQKETYQRPDRLEVSSRA